MKIVFSVKQRRPGCALLQAACGGTVPSMVFGIKFPFETWLTDLTPDMGAYEITEAQLERLSVIAREAVDGGVVEPLVGSAPPQEG